MIRSVMLVLGGLAFGAAEATAQRSSTPACLAMGFGQWLPDSARSLPAGWDSVFPHLELNSELLEPLGSLALDSLRALRLAPHSPTLALGSAKSLSRESRRLSRHTLYVDGWRPVSGDSLELLRYAALGDGFWVRGAWRGDTLIGRAHSFTDAIWPPGEPRANVYGLRYHCRDRRAALAVSDAIQVWRQHERPDMAVDRAERQAQERALQQMNTAHP